MLSNMKIQHDRNYKLIFIAQSLDAFRTWVPYECGKIIDNFTMTPIDISQIKDKKFPELTSIFSRQLDLTTDIVEHICKVQQYILSYTNLRHCTDCYLIEGQLIGGYRVSFTDDNDVKCCHCRRNKTSLTSMVHYVPDIYNTDITLDLGI